MASFPAASPVLPRAEIRDVPGRGEIFVRTVDGPADAVPVLLLHGWYATADINFFPLYEALGAHRRVVAPDLRGHGRSFYPEESFTLEAAADDCIELLRDLGIDRVIIAGYSLGCAVAQTIVDRAPDLVAGMVFMGGELAPGRRPQLKVATRLGGWFGTIQRLTSGRQAAHRMMDKAVGEWPDHERYRTWLVRELERGHTASLREAGRAYGRFDGRDIARQNGAVPVVCAITTRDRLVAKPRQEGLASAWSATVIEVDADHDAPVARPDRFVDAMVRGVATVADVSGAGTERNDRAIA